jgi:hypothetical protein
MPQKEIKNVMRPAIDELTRLGWYAIHPSPPAYFGYPDIDAKKDDKYLLIEVKDFTGLCDSTKIKSCFTKYQIPWMVKNCGKMSKIFLLIKKDDKFYWIKVDNEKILFINKEIIKNLNIIPYKESIKAAINAIVNTIN